MLDDEHFQRCESFLKDANQANRQGRLAQAEEYFQAALQEARQFGLPIEIQLRCLGYLGRLYLVQDRHAEGEACFQEGLDLARNAALGPNNSAEGCFLALLGQVSMMRDRNAQAERLLGQAVAILEKYLPTCRPHLAEALASLGILYNREGRGAEQELVFQRALELCEAKDPFRLALLGEMGWHYYLRGQHDQAAALLEESVASLRRKEVANYGLIHPLLNLADVRHAQGRMREMAALLKEALDLARRTYNRPHTDVALCLDRLAAVFREQEKYGSAERFARESLRIKQEILGARHSDVARALVSVAELRFLRGRYAEAEDFYRQALAAEPNSQNRDVPLILRNLAVSLMAQPNRTREAAPFWQQALVLAEELCGIDHPKTVNLRQQCIDYFRSLGEEAEVTELEARAEAARNTPAASSPATATRDEPDSAALQARWNELQEQALNAYAAGDLTGAEQLYSESLAVANQFATLDHRLGLNLSQLAGVCFRLGKVAEHDQFARRALSLTEQAVPANDPALAIPLEVMAEVHTRHGDWVAAEPLRRRALDLRGRVAGEEHPDLLRPALDLGVNLWYQGRYAEAEPFFRRAVIIGHKALEEDSFNLGLACYWLAVACEQLGRAGEAAPLLRRALAVAEAPSGQEMSADIVRDLLARCDRLGEQEAAERALRLVLLRLEQALGPSHPDLLPRLHAAMEMYTRWGRPGDATGLANRSLDVAAQTLAPDAPQLLEALRTFVNFSLAQRHIRAAESACQQFIEHLQPILGQLHPQVLACQNVYADVLVRKNWVAVRI